MNTYANIQKNASLSNPFSQKIVHLEKLNINLQKQKLMGEMEFFKDDEKTTLVALYRRILRQISSTIKCDDTRNVRKQIAKAIESGSLHRDQFGLNPVITGLQTAIIVTEEIGLQRASVISIMLCDCVSDTQLDSISTTYGADVATIIRGLVRIADLYSKNPVIKSENFKNLLLSFAEDMRVILIMIANRVNLMRQIRDTSDNEARIHVSEEAAYLYAPLAHKLGLYQLKSELEDLSLKYIEHDAYYMIKEKLNATKQARDKYIESFIAPISKKLTEAGLRFHIKGRTKSIHSIWQKMKKQKCGFEGIYDLFAIRIILDSPLPKEKLECWHTYSLVTDMYQPNPKRLRDWLSVPKSNGYECLHITVLGPESKWVEVQIRTERMDEIAERGFAAHWRYKGIKSDSDMDTWLSAIRTALESSDSSSLELMDQFKVDLYEDEVFVFTPKGDLYRLTKGATVLDFAYHIHSKIGNTCIGAIINGKNVNMKRELQSGDQVEILTSNSQTPKQDWLSIATTGSAKSRIRKAIKDLEAKRIAFVKEEIERKFKNRKIEYDESVYMHLIKKLGYKQVSDFYVAISNEQLDINTVIDRYVSLQTEERTPDATQPRSAQSFSMQDTEDEIRHESSDVLVIDQNLKGIDFTLSRCCHPIYGDDVFGFVTINGGIKIHRCDCPNSSELRKRFGYRIVRARWAGKGGSKYPITLRVVGQDDIGIVNNITSIINKESDILLRSISIDSNDGLFAGNLTVMVDDTRKLEALVKKIQSVKGVKGVSRN